MGAIESLLDQSERSGSDRGASRDSRDYRPARHQSVDMRGPPPRFNDRYYPEDRVPEAPEPRYKERYPYERHDPRYDEPRDGEPPMPRGRRRRDSF